MKRTLLLSLALVLAAASASAQGITMGAMNGWMFSFSGNVNAFLTYTDPKCSGSTTCNFEGSLIPVGTEEKVVRIQTGLAPAFAIFEAKGKEGGIDLGVHFGFAPEIQSPLRVHDNCGGGFGLQCGTQIDMREVYLTAGGSWGQILAGRALGVYQKQNLLTDMTVFGVGLTGGGAAGVGTTLGHIGTGYTYPNFNAQMTYSTAGNKPGQLTIGLFDPSIINDATGQCCFYVTQSPRLEAEYTYTKHSGKGSADKLMLYVSGLLANVKNVNTGTGIKSSVTPWGIAGGVEWANGGGLQLDGSFFYQGGVGSTLMFTDGLAIDNTGELRTSYGYLLQAQFQPKESKWLFGLSYGLNHLSQTTDDKPANSNVDYIMKDNSSIVGAITYKYTKSLRAVLEYTYGSSEAYNNNKATSSGVAAGLMLFF